jgi:hypothetical protein|tara:strand:+ start:183 stop:386 length:204 start_codon:yes stop_codon:yes gene_type:complete
MRQEQFTKINDAKFDMAGVEGVLEDFSKCEYLTKAELRSCMARMAHRLGDARIKISTAIQLHPLIKE